MHKQPHSIALQANLIEDIAELRAMQDGWDALARATASPFGAPAWALAWWDQLAPDAARLAVVTVRDRGGLVGVAPFYSYRRFGVTELRLLSGGWASRLGILASPGREAEVASAISDEIAKSNLAPDLIRWEAIDVESSWPGLLCGSGPDSGGSRLQELSRRSAPIMHLAQDSFEEWMAAKSRNFRSQMRRSRRAIEREGATFRCADRASLERDLDAFAVLHSARWEGRGGSSAITPGAVAALWEIAESLIDAGRFRLWLIDAPGGESVSAQIFVAAGGEVAYWNGGFDESWGKHHPGAVAILAAVEDAFEREDKLIDLGGGEARYKDRLADDDRPVAWYASYRGGIRRPWARLSLVPELLARRGSGTLRGRLGNERLNRLRQLFHR